MDFNGHVVTSINRYEGVYGGHRCGIRNEDSERLVEFADSFDVMVVLTKSEVWNQISCRDCDVVHIGEMERSVKTRKLLLQLRILTKKASFVPTYVKV